MSDYVDLDSSNIAAAKLEGNTLYVKFKNGSVYSYDGVDRAMFDQLTQAASVGKFFAANIKNNYSYRKEN